MKLWQLKPREHIRFKIEGIDEIFVFEKIDGAYSKCYNEAEKLVHIHANTDVEVVND
jgi:hypothetical protein